MVETNPSDFSSFAALHALLTAAFAPMVGRIDPPSSMAAMSADDVRTKVAVEDLFLIRADGAPIACLFGTPQGACYHIGKLAVAATHRRRGYARALIDAAATRATALGLAALELQTRVELVENHASFAAMGFTQVATTAHPGYDRPTSLTFRRPL